MGFEQASQGSMARIELPARGRRRTGIEPGRDRRVESLVDVFRWERDLPERRRQLAEEKSRIEELLKGASGETRKKLQEQHRRIEELLAEEPPPLRESDRELLRRFWADLDRVAPGRQR